MGRMSVPPHKQASLLETSSLLGRFLASGGVTHLVQAREEGYPAQDIPSAGLTRVPFLLVCVEGEVDIAIMSGRKPTCHTLHATQGVFMKSQTWIGCNHQRSPLYFRITFDTDYTLFGFEQKAIVPPPPEYDNLHLCICPRLPGPGALALLERLERGTAEHYPQRWGGGLATALLCELIPLLDDSSYRLVPAGQATWLTLRTWVETHAHLPIDREQAAQALGISPGHVSRLFTLYGTGGFSATLQRYRLEAARNLLQTSSLGIARIAQRCGFSCSNYFVRAFRSSFDLTPGAYRRAITTLPKPVAAPPLHPR